MQSIMQITIKNGVIIKIGVKNFEDYIEKKKNIIKSEHPFIDIIDACTICKNDISLIEYFEVEEGKENA